VPDIQVIVPPLAEPVVQVEIPLVEIPPADPVVQVEIPPVPQEVPVVQVEDGEEKDLKISPV
jgi:hypothetical protein